jgi:hypothetical protein
MTLDASGRLQIASTNNTGANTKLVVGAGLVGQNGIAVINTGDVNAIGLSISNWTGSTTSNRVVAGFDNSGFGGFSIGLPAATNAFYIYDETTGTERARISSDGTFRVKGAGTAGSTDAFQVAGTAPADAARITSGGNFQTSSGGSVQVGGTAARATTAGTNRVDIFDGTAPVGTLANGVSFYSTAGEARVMDAAGNATLLSPHDTETNEWIFHSKHTPSGKVLKIDVEKMLRFINDHFGLDAIHEFTEE